LGVKYEWQEVMHEQFSQLNGSGLLRETQTLYIGILCKLLTEVVIEKNFDTSLSNDDNISLADRDRIEEEVKDIVRYYDSEVKIEMTVNSNFGMIPTL